jgi:hypothetical protein
VFAPARFDEYVVANACVYNGEQKAVQESVMRQGRFRKSKSQPTTATPDPEPNAAAETPLDLQSEEVHYTVRPCRDTRSRLGER